MQRILASALMRLAVIAAALTLQQAAQAQTRELATKGELLDRVAAIVNDGVVLNSELDAQVEAVSGRLRQQKLELPPQNVLRQQVLERLVLQEIQMQRANRAGVKVSDETVNAALQDVAKRNGMTLSQLPDALAKQGEDYASYRDDLRKEITLSLLRQRDVLQHISVTPREIDQFLEKQAKTPSERNEYNVSHILIAVAQDASPAQLDRIPHHQAERGARRQREGGGGSGARAAHPHEDHRARRRCDRAAEAHGATRADSQGRGLRRPRPDHFRGSGIRRRGRGPGLGGAGNLRPRVRAGDRGPEGQRDQRAVPHAVWLAYRAGARAPP